MHAIHKRRWMSALTTVVAASAAVVALPSPSLGAEDRAVAAAESLVQTRPAALHAGGEDEFTALAPVAADGWYYVPYERSYRRLPVVGGDFVVLVGPDGRANSLSVAQHTAIRDLEIVPRLTAEQADTTAASLLDTVEKTEASQLVVFALGDAPRLAWRSTVAGVRDNRSSRLTVIVDAATGDVLDQLDAVAYDTGTGGYNGPAPLWLSTSTISGVSFLKDPVTARLSCGDFTTGQILYRTGTQWGDGDLASRETQCVDAFYAAQTQVRMLSHWLGRNGMDGNGGAWPILVGWNEENASFNGTEVRLGSDAADRSGNPMTTMDIVAHEFGHGIDTRTPGGLSRKGTQEFVADAFAVATEWYSAQPAPYDTPDYDLGEEVRGYPLRRMYQRSAPWVPECYYDGIDTAEEHEAGQVGDHWFYLLAEGSNPTNGQPASSTCDRSTVEGIGLRPALKVLYHAMLAKTSNSSYPSYRVWTLAAAKNVFADNCLTFQHVRAAWDAVNVPAQPGEAQCTPATSGGTGTVGGNTGTIGH